MPLQPKAKDRAGDETKATHSEVAEALERKIVMGDYAAGQRLTEREVSSQFGCTNAAAREVFHILGIRGAIYLSSRRGASVFRARAKPSLDILETWQCLYRLLLSEVRAAGPGEDVRPPRRRANDTRYDQLLAFRAWLARLAAIAGNERLGAMLSRIATHVFIGAPELVGKLTADTRPAETAPARQVSSRSADAVRRRGRGAKAPARP